MLQTLNSNRRVNLFRELVQEITSRVATITSHSAVMRDIMLYISIAWCRYDARPRHNPRIACRQLYRNNKTLIATDDESNKFLCAEVKCASTSISVEEVL